MLHCGRSQLCSLNTWQEKRKTLASLPCSQTSLSPWNFCFPWSFALRYQSLAFPSRRCQRDCIRIRASIKDSVTTLKILLFKLKTLITKKTSAKSFAIWKRDFLDFLKLAGILALHLSWSCLRNLPELWRR